MWSVFGIFYLIALMQSQLNQNKALNTTEYSSIWKTNDVLTDNAIQQQYSLITRPQWDILLPTTDLVNLQLPAQGVIIAHTQSQECYTQAECVAEIRKLSIGGIGYNFLIGGDGSVYEGYGWDKIEANNKCNNSSSICIAFIGDFNAITPLQNQLNAAQLLIDDGLRLGKLTSDYKLYAHTQITPPSSPENELYKFIKNSPHFYGNSTLITDSLFKFVSRSNWNAQPADSELIDLILPIKNVIVAHTATRLCLTQEECKQQVKNIQKFHIESRGFDDIGYNFLVGGDGSIYEGRGWDKMGAHTKGYNSIGICIAFIGNFHFEQLTPEQLNATLRFLEYGIRLGKLSVDYEIKGQRQLVPTESPGRILFNIIKNWPHFPQNNSKKINMENKSVLRIISRSEWIAQPTTEPLENQNLPIQRVIIAHTATDPCSTQAQCTFRVRYIQTFHMESRGFNDIAYNFLIGGDGGIFEGRGWDKVGVHTKGYNNGSVCIAFIGTFNTVAPSESQLTAAINLIEDGVKLGKLKSNYDLYGHKQLIPTTSPGQKLFDVISSWPHFFRGSETQNVEKLSIGNEIKDQKQLVTTESPDSKKDNIDNDYILENKPGLRIISRSEWIAQPPNAPSQNQTLPIQRVIIAHTATEPCSTQAQCTFRVRYIQTFHIEARGFDDIAYNFLIGGDGSIYEGRGWDKFGAHTKGYNYDSVCVAFIGTFDTVPPSESQLTAAINLIEDGVKLGKLKSNYDLYGHKQLIPTTSPGQKLFDVISSWPHFFNESETEDISKLSVDNEIKDQKELVTTESSDSKKDNIDNNHILQNKPVHRYIPRSEWIAQAPSEPSQNQTLPIQKIIIAHTATEPCSTQAQCTLQVRYIQTFHIESRGLDDIAYNFLIGGDGAIYEGRGWDKVGAHTKGYNIDSLCIAFIGTFNTVAPSESQLTAAITLIEDGVKLGKLNSNYDLYGHKQLIQTTSPGQKLFNVISTWPHFFKQSETQDINTTLYKVKT